MPPQCLKLCSCWGHPGLPESLPWVADRNLCWSYSRLRCCLLWHPDSVYAEIKKKAKDAVLKLIECERDGEQINRPLVKNVLGIFQEVGMSSMDKYEHDFEDFLLSETAAFYQKKAAVWVQVRTTGHLPLLAIPLALTLLTVFGRL